MYVDYGRTVQEAQCLICRAKLRILEEQALAGLAGHPGLAMAPLWPPSPVIQIVTLDGVHQGRVRREHATTGGGQWYAVPPQPGTPSGPYKTDWAAAHSLTVQQPTGTRHGVS